MAEAALRRLVDDALAADPGRYGRVARFDGDTAITETGVRVTVDWPRLRLSQSGRDTRIKELWGKDAHRGIAKH